MTFPPQETHKSDCLGLWGKTKDAVKWMKGRFKLQTNSKTKLRPTQREVGGSRGLDVELIRKIKCAVIAARGPRKVIEKSSAVLLFALRHFKHCCLCCRRQSVTTLGVQCPSADRQQGRNQYKRAWSHSAVVHWSHSNLRARIHKAFNDSCRSACSTLCKRSAAWN